MKRVRKSHPEPQELAEYRTRFVNAPTPPGWDAFKKAPERREPVKTRLREDQRGLCAYCENRLVPEDESVEHFVPKSANHALELHWSNLLLCCAGGERPLPEDLTDAGTRYDPHSPKTCGHAKRAKPWPILNPFEIPAFPRLFRFSSETGAIQPDEDGCRAAGVDATLAGQTVTGLGLHAGRLNRARLAVLDDILSQLASDGSGPAFSSSRAREIARQLIPVSGTLPPFFTTIRWVLGAGAEIHLVAAGFEG
jgi:uncharacterized protein (TIGR02646 family)